VARKPKVDSGVGGEQFVQIILFVPSADRDGRPRSDQEEWKEKAFAMFAEVFGKGATAMPRAEGVWPNPQTGRLVKDEPILIYCFVSVAQVSDLGAMRRLRTFCLDMGHAMHQGEVLVLVGDRMIMLPTF
jgi:hypothetical protein